jgi:surfactin synthase thioesterase subunit
VTSGAGAARLEPHRRTRWLLRAPAADGQARLFCFPYSGTGASMYRGWPRWIGGTEVCPLQPPGRENRIGEPHYGTYQNLADSLAEELLPYLDRPFAFIGHCGGSLPGVETTMRLAERGLPTPTRVFISSEVAPQDGPSGRFLWLTDAELVHELELLARRMGSQPDPSLIDLGLEIIQQDVAANRRYHYPEPPRLPAGITVIGWSDDAEIAPALMGGWELCAADVRYVTLDGGHHAYMSAPRSLLDEIAHDMDRAIRDALA